MSGYPELSMVKTAIITLFIITAVLFTIALTTGLIYNAYIEAFKRWIFEEAKRKEAKRILWEVFGVEVVS
jgi:hypothetical protein